MGFLEKIGVKIRFQESIGVILGFFGAKMKFLKNCLGLNVNYESSGSKNGNSECSGAKKVILARVDTRQHLMAKRGKADWLGCGHVAEWDWLMLT